MVMLPLVTGSRYELMTMGRLLERMVVISRFVF